MQHSTLGDPPRLSVVCVLRHDDPVEAQQGYLCLDHWSRLRSSLLELPAIIVWLEVNIAAGGNPGAEKVGGTREDPMPLRADITDLVGPSAPDPYQAIKADAAHQLGDPSIFDELRSWAELVEEESGATNYAQRKTVIGAVEFLAAHLSWISEQLWVDEFAGKVAELSRRAHRLAPWRPEIRRDPDPCTVCGRSAVVLHIAAAESRCEKKAGGCGRRQPLSEYVLAAVLPASRRSA